MDEIRLESYSQALIESFENDADTFAVLRRLSFSIRAEHEPIIHPKAELIEMVKAEDRARKRKAREEAVIQKEKEERELVERERAEDAAKRQQFQEELNARLDAIAVKFAMP